MQKQQSSKEQPADQEVHLYFTDQQLASRKIANCKSFDEILLERIDSDQHIAEVYSCLNEKIENYKAFCLSNQSERPDQINRFLQIKARLFYRFYRTESRWLDVKDRLGMFDVERLYELLVDIHRIRDQAKASIYKLFGQKTRKVKINGYLLIANIESLIKEIYNAAFPYQLYSHAKETIQFQNEVIQLSDFQARLMENELKQIKKWDVQWLNPLKNSLLELSDQLQTLKAQLKKEEQSPERQSQSSFIQSNYQITLVEKAITIYSLEYTMLHHEVVSHHSQYCHQKIGEGLYPIAKFIQKSPLYLKTPEKIQEIVSQNKLFLRDYTDHHYFLKHIAEKMEQIYGKQGKSKNLQDCSEKMIILLEKWINFCKYAQNSLLLFEIYIAVLRIHAQLDKSFLTKRENTISILFNLYMDKLISHYVDQHWIVMNRVVSFDQEFTSCLLTTNKIIQTLIQFQDKFIALIEQFAPFIQTFIEISKISQNLQDKWSFIESILTKIHYVSLKDQGKFNTSTQSMILQKNSAFTNIDIILSIDHESVDQIKPYLRQIKHILMLVTILKRANIKHNINKMQQQEYLTLKKCASYFSRERQACVIYQLKAKILLFVTLFKMGYHNPTVREDRNSVNLRNRIINLFNRLYSHSNISNVMISRINSISMRRSHSQQSYYIYDPLQSISERTTTAVLSEDQAVQLQASEELSTKVSKFIITNFVQGENNSKLYLTNLLNILEHQLFISEKDISQENLNLLSKDYTSHLKVCMDLDGVVNPNIQTILEIERLFYLEEHERAWNILTKEKKNNAEFNVFLGQLESSSSSSIELLKFMKLFNICEKMNHIFYSGLDSQRNINELVEMINANSLFTIARAPIETIYRIKLAENRLLQLQQFYLGKLNDSQSSTLDYSQLQTTIGKEYPGIKVYKLQKPNKTILKIQISQNYSSSFQRIQDQFKKYMLFNQIGIYKINDIKVAKTVVIQIQSNPYIVEDKASKFQSKILTFSEGVQEKFCRRMLQVIVQALSIFYEGTRNNIEAEQIDLTMQPLSFCINPFFGLILKIIRSKLQKKPSNSQPSQLKTRRVIESLLSPFLSHLSAVFIQHIYYFLQTLSTPFSKKKEWSFNKLLELPLFMTLQEKQVFLVYFDNRMSEMCDNFHQELRKLRKEKKYREIDQLRTSKMKDPVYRNYSYHFIVGGVLEAEMIFLSVCSQRDSRRLDWITEHKKLMISYDLPKTQNGQEIKEYAYSLNYFLKYLRGALAHKIENNYHIINNISQEFPKIFDYLHRRKAVLELTFEKVMNVKNEWIRGFNADGKEADSIRAVFRRKESIEEGMNDDVKETISHLKKLQEKYTAMRTILSAQSYACQKCNQFINIAKKSPLLLDLLTNLHLHIAKKNHFLSVQHNFKQCFLNETLKTHRVLEIFGATRRVEPKHHLVICWWFYLETELPCLTSCIDKLRWILEEQVKPQ